MLHGSPMHKPTLLTTLGLVVFTPGMASANPDLLNQIQLIFPTAVQGVQADCPAPQTLSLRSHTLQGGGSGISFYCWDPPNQDSYRSGQWLGSLPLQEGTTPFVEPFTCAVGADSCQTLLPRLQAAYPTALAQAEFQCSIKRGTLFLVPQDSDVKVGCGFFATTVYDQNGDGIPDYEDPISVDIAVTTLPLP